MLYYVNYHFQYLPLFRGSLLKSPLPIKNHPKASDGQTVDKAALGCIS